ncbi:tetratricopeptide repeat protein [Actinomadura gamaensis]|uniref:Tetratricopeptide repeat protein n=1 Tax=Actinomadura gamaensis TaxID=1763541 RepID=A0ABV9TVM5_9ACTN
MSGRVEELLDHGRALEAEGELDAAGAVYRDVLDMAGLSDTQRADALHGLGLVARLQGRYAEAEGLLRRGIAVAEDGLGRDAPETAYLLNELAVLFKYAGRFDEAEALYRRALAALERADDPDPADLAGLCHNLGGLEHARGDYARAAGYARRSVELRVRARGEDHPDVAADRAALAAILDALGEDAEAEALFRAALGAFDRAGNEPEAAVTRCGLAALLHSRGDLDGAEALYREALAVRVRVCGADHPDLGVVLHNLALLCEEGGRAAEAARLYGWGVRVLEPAVEAGHPALAACRGGLAATGGASPG